MAGRSSFNDDEPIADINVTPLVDVVLVLLIIFMITAPVIYQTAIKVKLPNAATGSQSQKTPLHFVVNKDGKVHWGSDVLDWAQLDKKLATLDERSSAQPAMISADETTPHGVVVKLMDILRKNGLNRFALNVDSGQR